MRPRWLIGPLLPVAVLLLAACGSDGDAIPSRDADRLIAVLNELKATDDCELRRARADEAQAIVDGLPGRVDRETRNGLSRLLRNLDEQIEAACAAPEVDPEEELETEPPEPPPSQTEEPEPQETDEQPEPPGRDPEAQDQRGTDGGIPPAEGGTAPQGGTPPGQRRGG